ncbi:hypothetical protein SETIT_1G081600v2 [Setaria italica]|uniref:Mei2-like C-terminal RNA recognition motif domain-containing protein n=1 Tax=Setaria italica TaxID=4555 RepID=A0A368PII4_SETIT|nr:hypothetical protein SETIT_1G081600v2 [Setaria italica]
MAATKLNPAAPPFPCPYGLHLAPPAPPPFPPVDAACPPQFPFITYCCVAAPPAGHIGFCFPVQPPSSPPAVCKGGVPAAAAAVHGRPPHKLMAAFSGLGGAGKRQAAAAVAVKPWQGPTPDAAAPPALVPAAGPRKPRAARRKAERSVAKAKSKTKAPRPRKAAGPRARAAAKAQRESSPPPPQYTTRRPRWWKRLPEPAVGWITNTVMLRNIPNKLRYALDQQRSSQWRRSVLVLDPHPNDSSLVFDVCRSSDMISLLDQHCKLVNTAAGAVVSAYDVLYLPMDFRRGCNFGYAFINFTTTAASRMLYYSLQGSGWTVHGSKKVIQIVPAKIQGQAKLVRHLKQLKLECEDEFLPAVFSPPRDGVTAGGIVQRLGRLARRPATTTAPARAAAATPAPKEQ